MILRLDEVDSTNEYAKRFIEDGWAGDDMVVISAQYQSAGKGRRGRSWESQPGTSLMYSMIIDPKVPVDRCPRITLICALAVHEALRINDIESSIKWPNDIVVEGRKLCGILTEAVPDSRYVIVGVGINLTQDCWPDELSDKAISVLQILEEAIDEDKLLDDCLYYMEQYLEIFSDSGDLSEFMDEYNDAIAGKKSRIVVHDPQGEYEGVNEGIDSEGKLLVRKADGEQVAVYAGEVSIGGIYGMKE